ncbi:flagellar biosynthetic protein FliO [Rheinheimera sp.]|uniref:flagellar biosynthetic protein FliO n=1 Tax=Rheinheimera sp. TaxID=1869214 RepID=UPI0040489141
MRFVGLIFAGLLCLAPAVLAQQQSVAGTADGQPASQAALNADVGQPAVTPADKAPDTQRPAALQPNVERPTAGVGLGKMAVSLLIVVAIVIALGWTFKKLTLRLPGSRHIKIISTMPLGPKEKLLVIEVQGKQRVLGVTAHSINLLFELENSLPEEKLASDFHTQLQSLLKK